jgi:hypothetical protein
MSVSRKDAYRIIAYTAKTESGGKFTSWNADDTGAGISFGLIQFNQAGGRLASKPGSPLAKLFKLMHSMAPAQFATTFGPYATNMIKESWVKNTDLNEPDFKRRLLAAAAIPVFQDAQLEMARKDYFAPAEAAAKAHGIKSERGHAMLFDTAVQWGPARMRSFLDQAAQVHGFGAVGMPERDLLQRFAERADAGQYTRRAKILIDGNLSDASVVGLGIAGLALAAGIGFAAWKLWTR